MVHIFKFVLVNAQKSVSRHVIILKQVPTFKRESIYGCEAYVYTPSLASRLRGRYTLYIM